MIQCYHAMVLLFLLILLFRCESDRHTKDIVLNPHPVLTRHSSLFCLDNDIVFVVEQQACH
jgi:hypothetical protein